MPAKAIAASTPVRQTTPTRPTPITWTRTPAGVQGVIRSFTDPTIRYFLSRTRHGFSCTCPDWMRHRHIAGYQCKHGRYQTAQEAAEAMCAHCGIAPALSGMRYCGAACQAAAIAAELLALPEPAQPAEPECHATCYRCQQIYRWSDAVHPWLCGECATAVRVAA